MPIRDQDLPPYLRRDDPDQYPLVEEIPLLEEPGYGRRRAPDDERTQPPDPFLRRDTSAASPAAPKAAVQALGRSHWPRETRPLCAVLR